MFCVFLCPLSPPAPPAPPPPLLEQRGAPARVTIGRDVERGDAVRPEMAVALAQFAPGDDDAHAIVEGQGEGPYRPLGRAGLLVRIDDPGLALRADRLADRGKL